MGNVETARLTEGFFPIGITEYEGVIYIASVKNPDAATTSIPDVNPEPDPIEPDPDKYSLEFIPVPSTN